MTALKQLFERLRPKAVELLAVAAFLALGTAYLTQYGPGIGINSLFGVQLGLDPCQLCYYQRYPYMAVIGIGILAALTLRGSSDRIRAYRILTLGIMVLLLFIDSSIAGYHVGVEQKWWEGPNTCSGGSASLGSIDLSKSLGSKPIVRCDAPTRLWFGVSMAAYNLVIALSMAIFGLGAFLKNRREV